MNIWSFSYFCIAAPMPKKQKSARVTSKNMTMSAVSSARRLLCVIAEFITKRFCTPIGAT